MPDRRTNDKAEETPTISELFKDVMGAIWGNKNLDLSVYYDEFHHAMSTAKHLGVRIEKEIPSSHDGPKMVKVRFRDGSTCLISADGSVIDNN